MVKLNKVCAGFYTTTYRGHRIELSQIENEYTGKPRLEWFVSIDGEHDIEPMATRKEVLEVAMRSIDAEAKH